MSDIKISQAGPTQADICAGLVHALLKELSGGKTLDLKQLQQTAPLVLADPRCSAFLAFDSDTPIAVMMLNEATAIYATGIFGTITELYVDPAYRSQGLAAQLIDHALQLGRDKGWNRIEVGAPNAANWQRSIDFYLGYGFEEIGPRLRYRL